MADAIRIPLYSTKKQLLGYWAMRKAGDKYRVTFKYPGQTYKRYETNDAEHAVGILYNAYIGFLGKRLAEIDNQLAELPRQEYRRHGFRKGWLGKVRAALRRDKSSLVRETRKVLANKLFKLREAGWPQPPLPKLPWDDIDGEKTAKVAYTTRVGGPDGPDVLSGDEAPDQWGQPGDGGELPRDPKGAAVTRGGYSWTGGIYPAWRGPSSVQVDSGATGEPRSGSPVSPLTRALGESVWCLPRADTADRGETGDSNR